MPVSHPGKAALPDHPAPVLDRRRALCHLHARLAIARRTGALQLHPASGRRRLLPAHRSRRLVQRIPGAIDQQPLRAGIAGRAGEHSIRRSSSAALLFAGVAGLPADRGRSDRAAPFQPDAGRGRGGSELPNQPPPAARAAAGRAGRHGAGRLPAPAPAHAERGQQRRACRAAGRAGAPEPAAPSGRRGHSSLGSWACWLAWRC